MSISSWQKYKQNSQSDSQSIPRPMSKTKNEDDSALLLKKFIIQTFKLNQLLNSELTQNCGIQKTLNIKLH